MSRPTEAERIRDAVAGITIYMIDDDLPRVVTRCIARVHVINAGNREIYRNSSRYNHAEMIDHIRSLGYKYWTPGGDNYYLA